MLVLPEATHFAAALADPRFVTAAFIAALSGLVRGFSGFGSALIYVPLIAAVYEPKIAAATLLLIDFVCASPFSLPEFKRCDWRELIPVWLAAAIAVPVGAAALIVVDPLVLRWIIAMLVFVLLLVLVSGWRHSGRHGLPVSLGVGALSGLGAGAVQIGGPPVIIYWLSGVSSAATIRANLMVFFILQGAVLMVVYLASGLFGPDALALSALLILPFTVAMVIGSRWFRGASDLTYRRLAYAIVALSALVSLPLFDGIWR
ncbi:MAG: permease [Xanthobacteraceae bacterium]|nr:permease [Xanthobacteraceae bacterium]